jgi:hypothetical protein
MYETNARIELWVACQALFDSRHSNQHQSDASGIKGRAHLLKACHSQAISFIYQYEPGRVTNGALLIRLPAPNLSERWFQLRQLFGKPIVVGEKRVLVLGVALLNLLEHAGLFRGANGLLTEMPQKLTKFGNISLDFTRCINDWRCIEATSSCASS